MNSSAENTVSQDLKRSGLHEKIIENAGIKPLDQQDLRHIARGFNNSFMGRAEAGMKIPYLHTDDFFRVRLYPAVEFDNRKVKYVQETDRSNHLYFPPGVSNEDLTGNDRILLTEGEKKALKAVQEGLPCLGLSGIWGWTKSKQERSHRNRYELIDDFKRIDINRTWFLIFDSDIDTSHQGYRSYQELAKILRNKGADTVKILTLPGEQS